jgi:hypothetical protein
VTSALDAALFTTIWLSVLLFVAGEAGKRPAFDSGRPARWAWPIWSLGAMLCAVHMILAIGLRHGWSHEAAIESTARQTQSVYGLDWGGGVYVNYAFLAVWTAEVLWWRAAPRRYFSRPAALTWIVRAFFLIVLFNAAVVFASGGRGVAGLILTALLLWIWRPRRRVIPL